MRYLICEKCGGYYELQEEESIDDFQSCECGGKFRYTESIDGLKLNDAKSDDKDRLFCSNCGSRNLNSANFCKNCGSEINSYLKDKNDLNQNKPNIDSNEVNLLNRFMISISVFLALIVLVGYVFAIKNPLMYRMAEYGIFDLNSVVASVNPIGMGVIPLIIMQFFISFTLIYVLIKTKDSFFKSILYGLLAMIPYVIIMYLTTFPIDIGTQPALILLFLSSTIGALLSHFIKRNLNGILEEKVFNRFNIIVSPENDGISFNKLKKTKIYRRYKSRFFSWAITLLVCFTILGSVIGYSPVCYAANTGDISTLIKYLDNGTKVEQIQVIDIIVNYHYLFIYEPHENQLTDTLQNKISRDPDPQIRCAAVYGLSNFVFGVDNYTTGERIDSFLDTLNTTAKYDNNYYVRNAAQNVLNEHYEFYKLINNNEYSVDSKSIG